MKLRKTLFLFSLLGGMLFISATGNQVSQRAGAATQPSAILLYDCTGLPAWNATAIYQAGDKVKHNGNAFVAKWWTQNEEPQVGGGATHVWNHLGSCGGTGIANSQH